jgi:hypothetical protein
MRVVQIRIDEHLETALVSGAVARCLPLATFIRMTLQDAVLPGQSKTPQQYATVPPNQNLNAQLTQTSKQKPIAPSSTAIETPEPFDADFDKFFADTL